MAAWPPLTDILVGRRDGEDRGGAPGHAGIDRFPSKVSLGQFFLIAVVVVLNWCRCSRPQQGWEVTSHNLSPPRVTPVSQAPEEQF